MGNVEACLHSPGVSRLWGGGGGPEGRRGPRARRDTNPCRFAHLPRSLGLPGPSILGNAHFGATPIDSSLTSPVRPSSSKHACAAADAAAAAAGVPIHTGHCHANAKVAVALNMRGWKNS